MSSPPGSVSTSNCSCDVGFAADASGGCVPCAQGSYKNEVGISHCTTCGAGSKFQPAGLISVLAGSTAPGHVNEEGTKARFAFDQEGQSNLALTPDGSEVFVTDRYTYTIRAINLATGKVRRAVGNCLQTGYSSGDCSFLGPEGQNGGDGDGDTAQFRGDLGAIRMTPNGTAVVISSRKFRVVNITDGAMQTIFYYTPHNYAIGAMGVTPNGESIWYADEYYHKVSQVDIRTGQHNEVAGWTDGGTGGAGRGGFANGHAEIASFENPADIAFTPDGATALIAEAFKVRSIDVATRKVSILAGAHPGFQDGVGTKALFSSWIQHIVISPDGATAYLGCYEDTYADTIRKIDLASRLVTTIVSRTTVIPNPPYAWINDG